MGCRSHFRNFCTFSCTLYPIRHSKYQTCSCPKNNCKIGQTCFFFTSRDFFLIKMEFSIKMIYTWFDHRILILFVFKNILTGNELNEKKKIRSPYSFEYSKQLIWTGFEGRILWRNQMWMEYSLKKNGTNTVWTKVRL